MKNEKFPNRCSVLSFDDLNYEKIAQDSFKKDLVDWCKADRKKWLREEINTIYRDLYIPTRQQMFNELPEDKKIELINKKQSFGISMDMVKSNAMIRYAIERVKKYGSRENFIKYHGEYAFNRFFIKEPGAKLDTRWEVIEELIKNGFD